MHRCLKLVGYADGGLLSFAKAAAGLPANVAAATARRYDGAFDGMR